MVARPLPPYSFGQVAQIHPPSNSLVVHSFWNRILLVAGELVAPVEPTLGQVLLEPRPDLVAEGLGLGRIGEIHASHVD